MVSAVLFDFFLVFQNIQDLLPELEDLADMVIGDGIPLLGIFQRPGIPDLRSRVLQAVAVFIVQSAGFSRKT